jgi:hypothetical protein
LQSASIRISKFQRRYVTALLLCVICADRSHKQRPDQMLVAENTGEHLA